MSSLLLILMIAGVWIGVGMLIYALIRTDQRHAEEALEAQRYIVVMRDEAVELGGRHDASRDTAS